MAVKVIKLGGMGMARLDLTTLLSVERELGKTYITRVGILGAKSHNRKAYGALNAGGGHKVDRKTPADLTNADIGLRMERGVWSEHIPPRSFLRMPLETQLPRYFKAVGQQIMNSITVLNIKQTYKMLGIIAEKIIQNAFRTRGFGKWAPNAPMTIAMKGSSAPLIDSGQLRKSITSQVLTK